MPTKDFVHTPPYWAQFFKAALILCALTSFQATFLARIPSAWWHIDCISIFLFAMYFSKRVPFSLAYGALAGALLNFYSPGPHFFNLFYFIILFLIVKIVLRFFVISSFISLFALFLVTYFIKYILFYVIALRYTGLDFYVFFFSCWKEFLSTIIVSFFIYRLSPILNK